ARQPLEEILKQIEEQNIKNPGFEKLVDAQEKEALNPTLFAAARRWVTPEPGAGLIRDTPVLIAATDLFAYPGRGGALVYELDKEGKRILEKDQKIDSATKERRKGRRRRRRPGGMMGMSSSMSSMMGMMGGMPGMGGPPADSKEAKAE